jgi:hypothetical protein
VSTPWSRGRVKEETELEGGFCKVSVRHGNSVVTLFQLIKTIGAFLQIRQRERARERVPVFCSGWADLGQFRSNTVHCFSFSFSVRV